MNLHDLRMGYLLRRPAHHLPKEPPDRDGNSVLERCVLVVDGDNDVRDLLSQALADNGCDVRPRPAGMEPSSSFAVAGRGSSCWT